MQINRTDTYIVINRSLLNDSDRLVLTMLYEPIIGCVAVSLYFTLWSDLNNIEFISKEFTHIHLQNIMGIKLENIYNARRSLEAVGLLKTYKKDSNYVYELYSPLSANEFLSNPILATALLSSLGKSDYKHVVDYFKITKVNLKDFEDISTHFSDIYEMSMDVLSSSDDLISKDKLDIIVDDVIDIDFVKSNMKNIVNEKAFTEPTRKLINRLAYLYNFDNMTMTNLLKNSINEKGVISEAELKKNCKNYYSFENNVTPKMIYKSKDKVVSNDTTNMKEKLIECFSTTSPYDFLVAKYNGATPTEKDLKLLESLLTEQELSPGVINVLIDYVLRVNDNKLNKNFCMAIASHWKLSNIKTVTEAMEMAQKEHNKTYTKKKINNEVLPSWYGKDIKKQKMSLDDYKEMEDLLSEFE